MRVLVAFVVLVVIPCTTDQCSSHVHRIDHELKSVSRRDATHIYLYVYSSVVSILR